MKNKKIYILLLSTFFITWCNNSQIDGTNNDTNTIKKLEQTSTWNVIEKKLKNTYNQFKWKL